MTGACCIGLIRVHDEARWQEYVAQVGETVNQYGGTVLFRGIKSLGLAGEQLVGVMPTERVVALQFADAASARRWHDSPEYQRLIPIRDRGADVALILYTDGDSTVSGDESP